MLGMERLVLSNCHILMGGDRGRVYNFYNVKHMIVNEGSSIVMSILYTISLSRLHKFPHIFCRKVAVHIIIINILIFDIYRK